MNDVFLVEVGLNLFIFKKNKFKSSSTKSIGDSCFCSSCDNVDFTINGNGGITEMAHIFDF
jgi:hypothetical protein